MFVVNDGQIGPPGSTPPPQERQTHHLPLPNMPGLMLSELPEPPIPVSEIGPIPPPPMFSSPSPVPHRQSPLPTQMGDYDYEGNFTKLCYSKSCFKTDQSTLYSLTCCTSANTKLLYDNQ